MIFRTVKNNLALSVLSLVTAPLTLFSATETINVPERDILVVVGAPGTEEYGQVFESWAENWKTVEDIEGVRLRIVGLEKSEEASDKSKVQEWLGAQPKESDDELWLVFIGHGTFDGNLAKVNLRGPDISSTELSEWLTDFTRPLIIIDSTSSSGPFVNHLSAEGRIIITATKSGYEMNYARFGGYFSEAITDPSADLDRDGQTSLLEAFLSAGARVEEFYESEGRLASEHPLLDDNSDQLGTQADWFRGIRPVKRPSGDAEIDGLRAHQIFLVPSEQEKRLSTDVRQRRNELELQINDLRERKSAMEEDAYYDQLEVLLVELAQLYRSAAAPAEPSVR